MTYITFKQQYGEELHVSKKEAYVLAQELFKMLKGITLDKVHTVNTRFTGIEFKWDFEKYKMVVK